MKKSIKLFLYIASVLAVTACMSGKPFQPNPPAYTSWVKVGVMEQGVKQAMRECGYINLTGYGGPVASEDEVAKREICMFANGFRYKHGYKGICSLQGADTIANCKNYIKP